MRPWPPPPRKVRKHFLTRYTLKIGFQTYIFCLKVHSKCRKCRFRDPKFQNGISKLYILLKSALKMQEMPFQRPKFQKKIFGGACPRTPLKLCRHYGLPLTKIVATPLTICYTIYWGNESFLCCQTCTALRHWKQWSFAEMMLQS